MVLGGWSSEGNEEAGAGAAIKMGSFLLFGVAAFLGLCVLCGVWSFLGEERGVGEWKKKKEEEEKKVKKVQAVCVGYCILLCE